MGHGLQFEKYCFRLRMWHIVHETGKSAEPGSLGFVCFWKVCRKFVFLDFPPRLFTSPASQLTNPLGSSWIWLTQS